MRFISRWIFRFLILLLVLGVALVLLKDTLLKSWAEHRLRSQFGLDVRIGRMDVGIFTPTVTIENLRVYNRAEFGGLPLVDLAELHLEYDRRRLAAQELHLTLLRVNVAEINVVRNARGQTNLEALEAKEKAATKSSSRGGSRLSLDFTGIDLLNLSLGRLTFTDLKQPGNNWGREIGLKNEMIANIKPSDDLNDLVGRILLQHVNELLGRTPASVSSTNKAAVRPSSPPVTTLPAGRAGPPKK
jgi:uncharacterized protein involved in outer membrane biogenesis